MSACVSFGRLTFEAVDFNSTHVSLLYEMLSSRKYNISHKKMPTFSEHSNFVKFHPYRYWYLCGINGNYVGNFYITNENTVGVNISNLILVSHLDDIIKFIYAYHEPLSEIPSVRNALFSINVPAANEEVSHNLEKLGASLIQMTFLLPKIA